MADLHNQVGDSMPLSNFSGGERSRTLACFILSLWEMNVSPFRALDELDVYLDEVNRSQVEEQLIAFARANKEYQGRNSIGFSTDFLMELYHQFQGRTQSKGCPHCDEFSSLCLFTATQVGPARPIGLKCLMPSNNS